MTTMTAPKARLRLGKTLFAVLAGSSALTLPVLAQDIPEYPGAENLPEINIRVSDPYSQQEASGVAHQAYADYLNKASKGKIKVEIYWSGSLFPAPESADGIASGLADMGTVSPIYSPASFPIANWLTTVANQAGIDNKLSVSSFDAAAVEYFYTDEAVKKEFEERGLHIIGAAGSFGFDMMCTQPIKSLADFKGKRARAAGQVFSREAEAVGMVPVPLVPAEMYEAFQRGIVDCVILHPPGYNNFGLMGIEKKKYFINLGFSGFLSGYYSMNKAKWDALPDLAKQIFTDGYLYYREKALLGTWGEIQKFGKQIAEGEPTAIQPDQEVVDALAAFQRKDLDNMVNTAPPTVKDPKAAVDRFLALIDKYRGLFQSELGWTSATGDVNARLASWAEAPDYHKQMEIVKRELAKATPAP